LHATDVAAFRLVQHSLTTDLERDVDNAMSSSDFVVYIAPPCLKGVPSLPHVDHKSQVSNWLGVQASSDGEQSRLTH
jgi:hypothetical protein